MTTDRSVPGEMDSGDFQAGASAVFGLLGKMLFSYPERDWLNALIENRVFEETPFGAGQQEVAEGLRLLDGWTQSNSDGLGDPALDELRADYTRLFIGPDRVLAPPWESVHRSVDRLLFQEQTLQVREWYRRFGLETVNLHKEPDDHVGLEMAFVSHLATAAAEAAEGHDDASLSRLLEAERGFVAEHPVTWVPLWCEIVIRLANTDFYRGIALLTRGALTELAALLDVPVPSWDLDQSL